MTIRVKRESISAPYEMAVDRYIRAMFVGREYTENEIA